MGVLKKVVVVLFNVATCPTTRMHMGWSGVGLSSRE